ncbi:MAG: hypothetical protein AB7R89_22135 [Dehalococcoidia bacterium]
MYTGTAKGRRQQQGLPVTDRAGRAIGRLIGRQYHKLITRSDQILRSPPGFGFDVWAMDFYVLPRVDEIVVEDRVNRCIYRSTAANFIEHRIQINRGAGPQYVLPLSYWQSEEKSKPSAASQPDAASQTAPQLPSPSVSQRRLL